MTRLSPRAASLICTLIATVLAIQALIQVVWGGWWPAPAVGAVLMSVLAYRAARS